MSRATIFVLIKASSKDEDERRLQDVFKTSSSRQMFAGLILEPQGKINLLVTFIQWFVTQSKLSLIFIETLLIPHKTAYFLND